MNYDQTSTRSVICGSLVEWAAWLSHPSQSSCEYPLDPRGHAPTAPSSRPTLRRPTPIATTGPSFTIQLSVEGAGALRPRPLLSTSSLMRVGLSGRPSSPWPCPSSGPSGPPSSYSCRPLWHRLLLSSGPWPYPSSLRSCLPCCSSPPEFPSLSRTTDTLCPARCGTKTRSEAQEESKSLLVGLFLLYLEPVCLIDEQLARPLAPGEFLASGHRLGLRPVDAGGPGRFLGLDLPPSIGVGLDEVGLQFSFPA